MKAELECQWCPGDGEGDHAVDCAMREAHPLDPRERVADLELATSWERYRAGVDELSVWAVRYALGRSTYAVHNVVDTLIANSKALSDNSKRVIIADIDRAKEQRNGGPIGMDFDDAAWMKLRERLAGENGHNRGTVKNERGLPRVKPCPCECNSGGFCGGCGHAGCSGGINLPHRQ